MTKQQKFDAITKAYGLKNVEDGRESIYIIKDDCPDDVRTKLLDIQAEMFETFDIAYEIFAKAADVIEESGLEYLSKDGFDTPEAVGERASVYTNVRLSYLTMWNEQEISEDVPMFKSIHIACAYWYDKQVELAVDELREYIIKD